MTLRVTSALLLPVLLGTLCHMLLVKEAYASSIGIIPAMWKDGVALKCGGVISGALGQGSVAVFSKIASIIIFTVLFVVLLMVALRLTVGALIEKHRERAQVRGGAGTGRSLSERRAAAGDRCCHPRQKAPGPG